MTLMMMGTVAYFAYKNGWGSDAPFSWRQLGSASVEVVIVLMFPVAVWVMIRMGLSPNVAIGIALAVLLALDWYFDFSAVMALMAPVILIGGMTLGLFTPTEAAVAAVIWSLFLGLVRYRSMTLKALAKASFDTIETTASVLFIVTAASIFAWLLTVSQAAQILSDAILGITQNKWVFLLLANLLILFVGCFIDTIAAITILVPILLPIVLKLGIDPIHFGLIITLNLMIGLLHPPLGMVLFVLARVAKLSVERTTMAILPWLVPLLLALIAITYIPELTLWPSHGSGEMRRHDPLRNALRRGGPAHDGSGSGAAAVRHGPGPVRGRGNLRLGPSLLPARTDRRLRRRVARAWPRDRRRGRRDRGSAPGLQVGDRVAVNPSRWCGRCSRCREGGRISAKTSTSWVRHRRSLTCRAGSPPSSTRFPNNA